MVKSGAGAINPEIQWVNRTALVSSLITRVSEQTSVVINVVTPSVGRCSHQTSREAFFKFGLQRVVILVGTALKSTHITEEAGWRGTGEWSSVIHRVHRYPAQPVSAGS